MPPPSQKISSVFFIAVCLLTSLACTLSRTPATFPLNVRLTNRINQAYEAQEKAAALWDRVLFGETVSCAETLDSPRLFELSASEAAQEPLSVPVRDHLNAALIALHEATLLWENECKYTSPIVSIDIMRRAENFVAAAKTELAQASTDWRVWQP